MNIRKFECYIVGMKYQNVEIDISDAIKNNRIILELEPDNIHDDNAIAAFLIDNKIGYINRDAAGLLAPIIRSGNVRAVECEDFQDGMASIKIYVFVDIGKVKPAPRFKHSNKIIGIYVIIITDNSTDQTFAYVGQSVDVNQRIENHWRELNSLIHKNRHLQSLWNELGAECFEVRMLEVANKSFGNELEQQRWLAQRENHYIKSYKNSDTKCINIMDAKIANTAEAQKLYVLELKRYDEAIKRVRKEINDEIASMAEIYRSLNKEKSSITLRHAELTQYISSNSGIKGLFKTVDHVKLISSRNERDAIQSRLSHIEKELVSIAMTRVDLKMFRNRINTRKQLDRKLASAQLRAYRIPKTINWNEISLEERIYDDNWREQFAKYMKYRN